MASNTMRGVTRCRVCGAHLAIEHALAYCINKRCIARRVPWPWETGILEFDGPKVPHETLLTKSEEKAPAVESAA